MKFGWKLAVASVLITALPAAAQFHAYPGKKQGSLCIGCGEALEGLPTYPYDDPLLRHAGRYVDSSTTINVQSVGMRTVRADTVRVSRATGRLYIRLGEAIGGYSLERFFTSTLAQPLVKVSVMNTGTRYHRYGAPLEKVATPDVFFYAESSSSGWRTDTLDAQVVMTDLDADDRGYVYVGTLYWGWGISEDGGRADTNHMGYVTQVRNPGIQPDSIIYMKTGGHHYAVVSAAGKTSAAHIIYDVDTPASPRSITTRIGTEDGIVKWSRHDASELVAMINSDGHARVFHYGTFIEGGEPIANLTPANGRRFADLAFDEKGRLWIAETTSSPTTNHLWQVTVSGASHEVIKHDVYGSAFVPEKIAAGSNYVIVGGKATLDGATKTELRILRTPGGSPELVPTDKFFRYFYHYAPAGFVSASSYVQSYTSLYALRIVEWDGRIYLMYSAAGLGDVYELPVVPETKKIGTTMQLSMSPNPASFGAPVTFTATLTPESLEATAPGGEIVFARDGSAMGSAALVASGDGTYTATLTRGDLLPGAHQISASYAGDATYAASNASGEQSVSHVLATVDARAEESGVRVSWPAVPGIAYDLMRTSSTSVVPLIARVAGGEYVDLDVAPNTVYLYRVNAVYLDGSIGPLSAADAATTIAFTDAELAAGTTVKAVHLSELRTAVNALRAAAGLPAALFDGSSIASGATITADQFSAVRVAADQVRALLGLFPVADAPLVPGLTVIRREDVLSLRAAVQ